MKKMCSVCATILPIENFNNANGCTDGRSNQCRKCISKIRKKANYLAAKNKKKCSKCNDPVIVNPRHAFLCEKHYHFDSMRRAAKRAKKYVPSWEELEKLFERQGLRCALCKQDVFWSSKKNRKRGICLQHDNNGEIKFLCISCNSIHGKGSFGDGIYEIGINVKRCTICKVIKPRTDFYRRRNWLQPQCKKCRYVLELKRLKTKNNELP